MGTGLLYLRTVTSLAGYLPARTATAALGVITERSLHPQRSAAPLAGEGGYNGGLMVRANFFLMSSAPCLFRLAFRTSF